MKPPEEAKRDLVRQWVRKAENDFGLAAHLVQEGSLYPEAIGFNCQQAAEKLLKAFLVLHEHTFPKTHNLGELLDLVESVDARLAGNLRDITELNPYGIAYRYPSDFPDRTAEEAIRAFELAVKTRSALMPLLWSSLQPPDGKF
jgi:HEPN domain-containing protein